MSIEPVCKDPSPKKDQFPTLPIERVYVNVHVHMYAVCKINLLLLLLLFLFIYLFKVMMYLGNFSLLF